MQRRSFLTALASSFPAIGLRHLASQTPAVAASAAPIDGLHIVGSGNDTLHPTAFSSLLFRVGAQETGGGLLLIEHSGMVPGGPPLHLHLNQEEFFYVEEGAVEFRVGDKQLQLRAGESVLAPRRVPHTFSALPGKPARMLIAFCPAGKMEQFFHATEATPRLMNDAAYFRECEMEWIGPSPFAKSRA
jgi:mannose-6-phosphate isomerase-like protein (cupin superfamily)